MHAALCASALTSHRAYNYPPRDFTSYHPARVGQQFYWSAQQWDVGLSENCRLLHTSVAVSGLLPGGQAGLGLFAGQAFAEGAVVGFLWGRFATREEWDSIVYQAKEMHEAYTTSSSSSSSSSSNHLEEEEDFVAPMQEGVHRCIAVPAQANGASLLLASEQCPMAYVNHSASLCNVRIEVPPAALGSDSAQPPAYAYQYVRCVVSTQHGRGIAAGEEIFADYGWTPQYVQHLTNVYTQHLAELNRAVSCYSSQHPQVWSPSTLGSQSERGLCVDVELSLEDLQSQSTEEGSSVVTAKDSRHRRRVRVPARSTAAAAAAATAAAAAVAAAVAMTDADNSSAESDDDDPDELEEASPLSSSSRSSSTASAARPRVQRAPTSDSYTAAECQLHRAPNGWRRTVAKAHSQAKKLAAGLGAIYTRVAKTGVWHRWFYLRGGASQLDLLDPALLEIPPGSSEPFLSAADKAVVMECARLMERAVRRMAPAHPVPIKLAQLKLLFCKPGVGRQPLHFDLGKAEYLCFSALMAGCDTVGTHLPLVSLERQRELYRKASFAQRHQHPLCSDQLERYPAHFSSDDVATGDIVAFRCDTLHAGPLNDTAHPRIMLYALFTQTPYALDERKEQGEHQHFPCGEVTAATGKITAEHLRGAKRHGTAGSAAAAAPPMATERALLLPAEHLFAGDQYWRLCSAWCDLSAVSSAHYRVGALLGGGGSRSDVPLLHPLRSDTETCMRWGLQHALGAAAAQQLQLVSIAQLTSEPDGGPTPLHTLCPMDTPAQRKHAHACVAVILHPHACPAALILPRLTDSEHAQAFSSDALCRRYCSAAHFFTQSAAAGALLVLRGDTLHALPANRSAHARTLVCALFSPAPWMHAQAEVHRAWLPRDKHIHVDMTQSHTAS